MFEDNQIDIREGEKEDWKNNEEPDARIWTVEALRRRLRIGISKKRKIEAKKARRDLLATHIWKEEIARIEGEEDEEEQKERRTNKTRNQTTDKESHNEIDEEVPKAESKTWDKNMANKEKAHKALKEKAESSSTGARIRKRAENRKSQEEYEYLGQSTQRIKTHEIRESKRTRKETQVKVKRRGQKLEEGTKRGGRRKG